MKRILKTILIFVTVDINTFFVKTIFRLLNVKYGKKLKVSGKLFVRNNGAFKIGDNVTINSNVSANPSGGPYKSVLVVARGASMTIGNNVGVSGMCAVAQNSITIENDVMIGSGCCIYDTDFHSLQFEHRMNKPDMHIKTKPVKICKGAFIGARSIILKGVTIGENSVIGAGSIVTKNVPENEIWAGNPARFIKKI